MPMNLDLSFEDSEGREIHSIDLMQTSTIDTYQILGDADSTFDEIFSRYVKWLKKRAKEWDWPIEVVKSSIYEVQQAFDFYSPNYIPVWSAI